jgi:hypothetical protein
VTVRLPPLDEVLAHWPQIEAHLCKATERTGCYEPIDLLRLAFAGAVGIWLCEGAAMGWGGKNIEAVVVTEVKQYPRKRILDILFAGGGNMAKWMPELRAAIDKHAREMGCDHIASICRPGWVRAWPGIATGDIVVVRGLGEP